MRTKILSIAVRFGLPLLGFALIFLFNEAFKRAFGLSFDLTILMIALLIATAWYLGRAPGLLIAFLLEAAIIYFAFNNPNAPLPPTGRLIFNTVNRLALFVSLVIFASARRTAEQRLRERTELWQVTLNSIGDAVIATDAAGRITFINPTAENLTGWQQTEIKGRPLEEVFRIIDEATRKPIESPLTTITREGRTVELADNMLLVRKDGTKIPIQESGAPIRDRKGRIVGVVIVFHDVTERRRSDLERESLLLSEQIARREAELAGRLRDEFLATVSHELRTPLSAILGWATMLKKNQLAAADTPRAIEVIERNAKAQGEIINDLLDVSQITTGKMVIDRQKVEIGAIIAATAESLRPSAQIKSIELTIADGAADEFFVHGDAMRLRQIVWNILTNAVKFTPKGGSIDVRAARGEGFVEITVRDSGIGINENFLPFVFDKFRQGDASPTRSHGGLGLGLSIVKTLVEMHGGEIYADSRGAGCGSLFTVRLPLAESEGGISAAAS